MKLDELDLAMLLTVPAAKSLTLMRRWGCCVATVVRAQGPVYVRATVSGEGAARYL